MATKIVQWETTGCLLYTAEDTVCEKATSWVRCSWLVIVLLLLCGEKTKEACI